MQKFLFFTLLLFLIASRGMGQSLDVQINGWGNDTVSITYYSHAEDQDIEDAVVAVNGRITYDLPSQDTCYVSLISYKYIIRFPYGGRYDPDAMRIATVMAPGLHEKIMGKVTPRALEYTCSGSIPFFRQLSDIRWSCIEYGIAADSLNVLICNALARGDSYEQQASNFAQRGENNDQIRRIKLEYEMLHPDEEISAYYINNLNLQDFRSALPKLTPSARNGLFKNYIAATELLAMQELNCTEISWLVRWRQISRCRRWTGKNRFRSVNSEENGCF